jgi:predicted MFS family arabinose efflux permease
VFILVPVIAPSIGQAILGFAGWRTIFVVYLTLALVVWIWFAWRQEETLAPERRLPLSMGNIARGAREVVTNRLAFGYTMAAGLVYGAFIGYLSRCSTHLDRRSRCTSRRLPSALAAPRSAMRVSSGATGCGGWPVWP